MRRVTLFYLRPSAISWELHVVRTCMGCYYAYGGQRRCSKTSIFVFARGAAVRPIQDVHTTVGVLRGILATWYPFGHRLTFPHLPPRCHLIPWQFTALLMLVTHGMAFFFGSTFYPGSAYRSSILSGLGLGLACCSG